MITLDLSVKENTRMRKVGCPVCNGRLFDMEVNEKLICVHDYSIIMNEDISCRIAVKCGKCGCVVGIGLT